MRWPNFSLPHPDEGSSQETNPLGTAQGLISKPSRLLLSIQARSCVSGTNATIHRPSFLRRVPIHTILAHRRCHGSEEVAPACGPFVLHACLGGRANNPGRFVYRRRGRNVCPTVEEATQFKRQTSSVIRSKLSQSSKNRYFGFPLVFSLSESLQTNANPVQVRP
jgi:hypothetical protein